MVTHVPIVGILMIVNGSLQIVMGLMLAAVGPFMFTLMTMDRPQQGVMAPDEQKIFTLISIGYTSIGVLVIAAGAVNVLAGIRVMKYQSRTFAMTALFANLVPFITCYCLPTSMGLMIYGLIVLFQTDVAQAFKLGEEGLSVDEIKHRFDRRDYDRDRGPADDFDKPSELPPPNPGTSPDERFK